MAAGFCLIKTDLGLCQRPASAYIEIELTDEPGSHYVEEIRTKTIPICQVHRELFATGWRLQGRLAVSWVPPV